MSGTHHTQITSHRAPPTLRQTHERTEEDDFGKQTTSINSLTLLGSPMSGFATAYPSARVRSPGRHDSILLASGCRSRAGAAPTDRSRRP